METKHAVVLGGSVAGLLVAHTLARHFEHVTLIERDTYPTVGEPRKGVAQSRQLHGLLAGGRRALESMFPDFAANLVARGAHDVDVGTCGSFYVAGRALPAVETGLRCLLMSRPLLEGQIRELVLAASNIEARQQWVAKELLGDRTAISGVRVTRPHSDECEDIAADLVVDATGRGSHLPEWLMDLGLQPPIEDRVTVNINYTSCTIRRKPEHLGGRQTCIINPHPSSHRAGAALALEGERYIVALTGYFDEPAPLDYDAVLAFARSLSVPELYELLVDAVPLTEPVKMRFAASQRRRYERMREFPRGLLVCGDALCSFNAIYGQGMSVAALEAVALDACLQQGRERLFERYTRAAAKLIDVPWSIVVGGDYAFARVEGERTLSIRLRNKFMERLVEVAASDAVVSTAFLKVMHMCAAPSTLFAPSVLWRLINTRPSAPIAIPDWRDRAAE